MEWNDLKLKLQQCCLTPRTIDCMAVNRIFQPIKSSSARDLQTPAFVYAVVVYFRGRRLASAMAHSIHQAEIIAAKKELGISHGMIRIIIFF